MTGRQAWIAKPWSDWLAPAAEPFAHPLRQVAVAVLTTGLVLLLGRGLEPGLHQTGVVMLLFMAVVLCAYGSGVYASGLCALLSVGGFNYFFVAPRHSMRVDAPESWLTLAGLLLLSALVSSLTFRLQRAMQKAREALSAREREALRSTFLTSIAHDLRSPLASILAATASLKAGAPAAPLLGLVEREVRHMADIADNVLTLVRLGETQDNPLRADWQSLEEIIGSALNRHRQRPQGERVVRIATRVPAALPWVWADGPLLSQWLDNLLENAVRHAPGSQVEVGVEQQGQALVMHVQDNGPGYPRPWTGLATARLTRGDRQPGRSGLGLGLAICQAIADAHQAPFELGARLDGQPGARASIRFERLCFDPATAPVPVPARGVA